MKANKKTKGRSVTLPNECNVTLLREKIRAVNAEQPPFLPVHNPEFEACSRAIALLRTATHHNHRPIPLPSAMLPPLP
jgi:hypothetical protein